MDFALELIPGDSGAWVVDGITGEVYGHVVSIDTFGEAYVLPIQCTLDEIRSHIKAKSVWLPSRIEFDKESNQLGSNDMGFKKDNSDSKSIGVHTSIHEVDP